jgi:hypothetical protein
MWVVFCVVLFFRFELTVLHLLGKYTAIWAMTPALDLVVFLISNCNIWHLRDTERRINSFC